MRVPLFDAIAISPCPTVRFFEAGAGDPLAGSEHFHAPIPWEGFSNNPRSGRWGFPKGWNMRVEAIRAVTNVELPDDIRAGRLRFRVAGEERYYAPLGVLLARPQRVTFTLAERVPFYAELIWPEVLRNAWNYSSDTFDRREPDTHFDIAEDNPFGTSAKENMDRWRDVAEPVIWLVLEGEREFVVV
jgi:hypothetical protein